MTEYKIISENNKSTVVSDFRTEYRVDTSYQSEADLEKAFIQLLESQAYTVLKIRNEDDLISNLRDQLEQLNNYKFTENEWKSFFSKIIANPNNGVKAKTKLIQEDNVQAIECEDGQLRNITLIEKGTIHRNQLQVINQYETDKGKRTNRYDVTVLVNGLPMVHIELKRRGVDLKNAFDQIDRYARESFWSGSGLYEYIQIFVISNGTLTK